MATKLTKKAMTDAYKEIEEEVGGIDPAIDSKLKVSEYETELRELVNDKDVKKVLKKAELSKETVATIEALNTPVEEDAPVEEAPKEDKKAAKAKAKGKGKKAPKEDAPVEKETKAKTAKKGKGKKEPSVDELIASLKTMKKDEMEALVDSNPVLAKKADELKAIDNFFSFRKNVGLVLQGKEIELPAPKAKGEKKSKSKKGKASLVTKIEKAEDDELKGLFKENSSVFADVDFKALKKKAKKLRKAMIKAAKASMVAAPKKKMGVVPHIVKTIEAAGAKGISREDALDSLIEEFPNRAATGMKTTVRVNLPKLINTEREPLVVLKSGNFAFEKVANKKDIEFTSKQITDGEHIGGGKKSKKDKKADKAVKEEKGKKGKKSKKDKKGKKKNKK